MEISVDIVNTGKCDGAEVIQVYVADLDCSLQRPRKELKAFKKVTIILDKYALSFWSEGSSQWRAEAGDFTVIIATSADPKDEVLRGFFRLLDTFM